MSPTLMTSLKNFVNVLLAGHCHDDVIPVVFEASLIALEKNSGDVRHIAIGYMLRRLAVKFANNYALTSLGDKQLPEELGFGPPGGYEATVHASRRFISNMPDDYVLVKLDFSNVLNNLHRDTILSAVAKHIPGINKFCHLSYGKTTLLKFTNSIILSQ